MCFCNSDVAKIEKIIRKTACDGIFLLIKKQIWECEARHAIKHALRCQFHRHSRAGKIRYAGCMPHSYRLSFSMSRGLRKATF